MGDGGPTYRSLMKFGFQGLSGLYTLPSNATHLQTVSQLTVRTPQNNLAWNIDLLNQMWDQPTVSAISAIPLRGHYIYLVGKMKMPVPTPQRPTFTASNFGSHLPWNKIWTLNLPSKLKFFACMSSTIGFIPGLYSNSKHFPILHAETVQTLSGKR